MREALPALRIIDAKKKGNTAGLKAANSQGSVGAAAQSGITREALEGFYRVYDASKIGTIDKMLMNYRGNIPGEWAINRLYRLVRLNRLSLYQGCSRAWSRSLAIELVRT